jgi:pimeloyl-ACP methyl ester carboxylesterase
VREATIRLSDGRLLGYAEYGDPGGAPVLTLHGLPGSRFQRHPDESIATRLGARLMVFERPGFGLSSPAPRGSLLARAQDAAALADALGLARFRVLAVSGGAPAGCACAWALAGRIERLALVSGVGPPAANRTGMALMPRLGFALARRAPAVLRPLVALGARLALHAPAREIDRLARGLPQSDRRVLARGDVRAMFAEDLRAAFAQGVGAFVDDLVLSARPWGFAPQAIRVATDIWQGEADPIVPPAAARALAAIPGSRLHLLAGEGHYFVFERWEEILAVLLR